MYWTKSLLILHFLRCYYCDWIQDWMSPVQLKLKDQGDRKIQDRLEDMNNGFLMKSHSDNGYPKNNVIAWDRDETRESLKSKLHNTLQVAKMLANTLKDQIYLVATREKALKEAITNGREGVTTLKVTTMSRSTREYIIRDGYWKECIGQLHAPVRSRTNSLFNDLFSAPKCFGKERPTMRDPCIFNSIIKYEIVPSYRFEEYQEADFYCLRSGFNNSMEQYLSVPRSIINDTCRHGMVRTLDENIQQCGLRTMAEYDYYPHRSTAAANLPLEYCSEASGACKLIVGWHMSNSSVENFEFLKDEPKFRKYFIKGKMYNENE